MLSVSSALMNAPRFSFGLKPNMLSALGMVTTDWLCVPFVAPATLPALF